MKNVYKCKYINRCNFFDDYPYEKKHTRHNVMMLEDNYSAFAYIGDVVNTSPDIFFSRKDGVLVTQNSVYLFDNTKE